MILSMKMFKNKLKWKILKFCIKMSNFKLNIYNKKVIPNKLIKTKGFNHQKCRNKYKTNKMNNKKHKIN